MIFDRTRDDTAKGPTAHDISNQVVDPAPLTVAEVFPAAAIVLQPTGGSPAAPASGASAAASNASYQVVKSELTDCKNAVVGDLTAMLASAGCAQVVRATLVSPTRGPTRGT